MVLNIKFQFNDIISYHFIRKNILSEDGISVQDILLYFIILLLQIINTVAGKLNNIHHIILKLTVLL